jgi:hypothetical protein
MNPFVAGASGSRIGRPLQTAFGEVVRQIGLQTGVVVVVGNAGTGKSSLMDMTARACLEMGLSVRRVERGDQVHTAFGKKFDVLLVDQTDSMSNSSLQTLLSAEGKNTATTMVFMCRPSCVGRFNFLDTHGAIIELTPLSLSDSRNYLQERAASIGRANLFTPEALDLVIDGSRGLPRLLRSIAHLAFFAAASEGASQIGAQHVSNTLESRSVDGHNADVDGAGTPRQFDSASRIGARPGTDSLTSRVTFENQTRDTDTAAQPKFSISTKETDRPLPTRHKHVADASESWVTPNTKRIRDDDAQRALSREAAAEAAIKAPSISPAPNPSRLENVPVKPVKEFHRSQQRSADVWIPRAAGITAALVASVAIGVAIPWMLVSSKPDGVPRAAIAPLTVARPADLTGDAVQTPALAKETASPAKSPLQAPARSDTAVANGVVTKRAGNLADTSKVAATPKPASNVTAPAPAKAEAAVKTPIITNTAVQPNRQNSASQQAAAPKLVDEKARTETDDANRIKAVSDQTPSVVNAAEQTARGNDAADQAAALKAAEDNAAEQRAAADRAQAAEQAFLLAQEAGRQAKAARDVAERAKAEKDASERAKAERENANRLFFNSLHGIGR